MENYILFSWLIIFFAAFVGLYYTHHIWAPPMIQLFPLRIYNRLPESFTEDIEAGLTSDSFNLAQNIDDNDTRSGLDAASKREILKLMKSKKMNFDQARTQFITNKMAKNGIGPDGRPLDPRAVFFS
ncbi:hypothetical protein TWF694_007453 [Orbilia ellipsospora]|uniref:Uncharacterized protein n=1 Tax=Orbilia ellipsospora TaxID=2528407 RepID=A0AAV9XHS0_9PEZI